MKAMQTSPILVLIISAGIGCPRLAHGGMIGINVLLNQPPSATVLADLATHGQVLDVLAEIKAVTLRAQDSELSATQALPYVAGANPDRERLRGQSVEEEAGGGQSGQEVSEADFANGANAWNLDAINVTEF